MSAMDEDDDSALDLADQLNRPPDVAIQQQRIKAWHPILDPDWMIYGYLILAVILIPLGESCCLLFYQTFGELAGRCVQQTAKRTNDTALFSSTNIPYLMLQHRLYTPENSR